MLIRTSFCALRVLQPSRYSYTRINRPRTFSTTFILRAITSSATSIDNSKVEHAQFLAKSDQSHWHESVPGNGTTDAEEEELVGIDDGVGQCMFGTTMQSNLTYEYTGKLLPTTSHLFKLILPLGRKGKNDSPIPTVFLLHPSQPLSHVGRLILSSVPRATEKGPSVSFRSNPSESTQYARQFEWSDSTDIGEFIRDAARAAKFSIHIIPDSSTSIDGSKTDTETRSRNLDEEQVISVRVPTFADRTRYLRRRLDYINHTMTAMEGLKRECDREARKGARRMAVGGFGLLVVYWAAVARLTFWLVVLFFGVLRVG